MQAADYFEIQNLLNLYFQYVDAGKLEDCGKLFAHADMVYVPSREIISKDPAAVTAKMASFIRLYGEAKTPLTQHHSGNIVIEPQGVNRAKASCRAIIYQGTDTLPLQAIGAAHYRDEFEKRSDDWCFIRREMGLNLIGDLSHHLRKEIST